MHVSAEFLVQLLPDSVMLDFKATLAAAHQPSQSQLPAPLSTPSTHSTHSTLSTLQKNHTLLPALLALGGTPTLCVELKPKWGALPPSAAIAPRHRALKGGASRYQLHQWHKLQQARCLFKKYPAARIFFCNHSHASHFEICSSLKRTLLFLCRCIIRQSGLSGLDSVARLKPEQNLDSLPPRLK